MIAKLYEDRKIAKAAHNMYAYRIKQAGGNVSVLETVVFCTKNLEEIQNQTAIYYTELGPSPQHLHWFDHSSSCEILL